MADPAERLPGARRSVAGPIDVARLQKDERDRARRVRDAASALMRDPTSEEAVANMLRAMGRAAWDVAPSSVESEEIVIRAMVVKPTHLAPLTIKPPATDFHNVHNQKLVRAVEGLNARGETVDEVSFGLALEGMEGKPLADYGRRLVEVTRSVHDVDRHARIVVGLAVQRRALAKIREAETSALTPQADVAAWLSEFTTDLLAELGRVGAGGAFPFLSVDDLNTVQGEPDWVVPSLGLCPGRPAAFIGVGSSGKTTFALLLAACVASGGSFLEQFHCDRSRVVWLDFEMGKRAVVRKLQRLALGHGLNWVRLVENLRVSVYPPTFLNSAGCEAELERILIGQQLCFIDSLRRSLPGVDENDSRIADFLQMLARVSETTGCAIAFVHHDTTKASASGEKRDRRSAGRGSSAIFDGSGSYFVLDGPEDEPTRVTHVREPQEGRLLDPFHIQITDVADDRGNLKAGLRVRFVGVGEAAEQQQEAIDERAKAFARSAAKELGESIIAFLRDHGALSGARIESGLGGNRGKLRTALMKLVHRGDVVRAEAPKGQRGGGWFYSLPGAK